MAGGMIPGGAPRHVVLVYESGFGNTAQVAHAVVQGIRAASEHAQVDCVPVESAPLPTRVDLLVVGGPTHFLGLSTHRSRGLERHVARGLRGRLYAPRRAAEPGLRDWLHSLPPAVPGTRAAAFDTRVRTRPSGGAAPAIARRLRRRGYVLVATPTGFAVDGMTGPVAAAELDRARAWGAAVAPIGGSTSPEALQQPGADGPARSESPGGSDDAGGEAWQT